MAKLLGHSKTRKWIVVAATLDVLPSLAWVYMLIITYGRMDTIYSDGYSESKFKEIGLGMTETQVVELLGHPLIVGSPDYDGGPIWFYSAQGKNKKANYYERTIIFTPAHRVREILSDIYYD